MAILSVVVFVFAAFMATGAVLPDHWCEMKRSYFSVVLPWLFLLQHLVKPSVALPLHVARLH